MTTLTDDERVTRGTLIVRLAYARKCMEGEFAVYNASVAVALARVRAECERYNAVLAEAEDFCDAVAKAREEYDSPRQYENERVWDMSDAWFAAGNEIAHLTAEVDAPRAYTFVDDGEADPVDVLRDLPVEV